MSLSQFLASFDFRQPSGRTVRPKIEGAPGYGVCNRIFVDCEKSQRKHQQNFNLLDDSLVKFSCTPDDSTVECVVLKSKVKSGLARDISAAIRAQGEIHSANVASSKQQKHPKWEPTIIMAYHSDFQVCMVAILDAGRSVGVLTATELGRIHKSRLIAPSTLSCPAKDRRRDDESRRNGNSIACCGS